MDRIAAYKGFVGLRNTVDPVRFEPGDLEVADNIDLDNSGAAARRNGYAQQVAGAAHSIYASGDLCLFVQGGDLQRLNSDYSVDTLREGLTLDKRMSYHQIGGRVFYSNGVETGVVDASGSRSWGMEIPRLPSWAAIGGDLPEGRYQFTVTHLRADGQESGAPLAGVADVPVNGGIRLSNLPVSSDPTVDRVRVYLSSLNGDVLYRAMELSNGDTAVDYTAPAQLATPLQTQQLYPAPAGHIVTGYRGRVYVAVGSLLYHSEALSPELFMLTGFIPFADRIRMVAPVEMGLFVATETNTYFLRGAAPDEFTQIHKADYGAIEGSAAEIDLSTLGAKEAAEGVGAIWMSEAGIVVGLPDGNMLNMTNERYQFGALETVGAGVVRAGNGKNQYLYAQ